MILYNKDFCTMNPQNYLSFQVTIQKQVAESVFHQQFQKAKKAPFLKSLVMKLLQMPKMTFKVILSLKQHIIFKNELTRMILLSLVMNSLTNLLNIQQLSVMMFYFSQQRLKQSLRSGWEQAENFLKLKWFLILEKFGNY